MSAVAREGMHAGREEDRVHLTVPENDCMHKEPRDFVELVAPLERAARKRLRGDARDRCLAAFRAAPEEVRILADDALGRAHTNPIGLLIRMVDDGEHLLSEEERYDADVGAEYSVPCVRCRAEIGVGLDGICLPEGWVCARCT